MGLTERQCGLLSNRADRADRVRVEVTEYLRRREGGRAWGKDILHFTITDPGTFYAVVNLMCEDGYLTRERDKRGRMWYSLVPTPDSESPTS